MKGLAVGRSETGEARMFIVAIQADVTERGSDELPLEHASQLQHIANLVRDELVSGLQEAAIVTAQTASGAVCEIRPYEAPRWIMGEVYDCAALGG
eukprot:g703.t1